MFHSFCRAQLFQLFQFILLLFATLSLMTGCAAEDENFLSLRSESTSADTSSVSTISTSSTVHSTELLDVLAQVVIERNAITNQRDSLLQQRWLIVAYAVVTSLLVGWFIRANLLQHSGSAIKEPTLVVPVDAATRKRTNATITIRNSATQRPEIIERVVTRQLFKARPTSAVAARMVSASVVMAKPILSAVTATAQTTTPVAIKPATTPVVIKPAVAVTKPVTPAPSDPHKDYIPTDAIPINFVIDPRSSKMLKSSAEEMHSAKKPTLTIAAWSDPHYDYVPTDTKPTTLVISNRPSILLAPEIDDSVLETTQVRIARKEGRVLARQGFSLLEVMIALAILAMVLASIGGGIASLTSAKRSASEDTAVSDLMRMWSERIIGGDWEWLGRNRSEDPLNGAWSWQRPETDAPLAKGEYPPLQEGVKEPKNDAAIQVLGTEKSGLADLHLYLEYYQPIALELCFTPVDGAAARTMWADTRNAYRLIPPIDLRKQIDAVVVRLSATWTSLNGGTRRRELVFARIK